MPRLLVTAFEAFGGWTTNASLLCLSQLPELLTSDWKLTSRVYPVDFERTRPLLEADLAENHDLAIHLGQSQQTSRVTLEAVAINFGAVPGKTDVEHFPLIPAGIAAYSSSLPLSLWAANLRSVGIPAQVSYHAGTYLCNATLYWSQKLIQEQRLLTESCFIHVPLAVSQVADVRGDYYTLPTSMVASAVAKVAEMWNQSRNQSTI